MAGVLKSSKLTYEFSLDVMKNLIASDLGVPEKSVDVEYIIEEVAHLLPEEVGGDIRDIRDIRDTCAVLPKTVTKIKVTVDGQPIASKPFTGYLPR